jgi:hypothetical protein
VSGVQTVGQLAQRRGRNVEEIDPVAPVLSRKSFNDVGRHGIGCATQLSAQLVLLLPRKVLMRKTMNVDEQIVCALPHDQRSIRQRHLGFS